MKFTLLTYYINSTLIYKGSTFFPTKNIGPEKAVKKKRIEKRIG